MEKAQEAESEWGHEGSQVHFSFRLNIHAFNYKVPVWKEFKTCCYCKCSELLPLTTSNLHPLDWKHDLWWWINSYLVFYFGIMQYVPKKVVNNHKSSCHRNLVLAKSFLHCAKHLDIITSKGGVIYCGYTTQCFKNLYFCNTVLYMQWSAVLLLYSSHFLLKFKNSKQTSWPPACSQGQTAVSLHRDTRVIQGQSLNGTAKARVFWLVHRIHAWGTEKRKKNRQNAHQQ